MYSVEYTGRDGKPVTIRGIFSRANADTYARQLKGRVIDLDAPPPKKAKRTRTKKAPAAPVEV